VDDGDGRIADEVEVLIPAAVRGTRVLGRRLRASPGITGDGLIGADVTGSVSARLSHDPTPAIYRFARLPKVTSLLLAAAKPSIVRASANAWPSSCIPRRSVRRAIGGGHW
jgi:hypothetical protein